MEDAIIIDLDGTLCNWTHRLPLLKTPVGNGGQSSEFYQALANDAVNEWCNRIVELFVKDGVYVIFLTGRKNCYRELTLEWIYKNINISFSELFGKANLCMRADDDTRSDSEIKSDIYHNEIKDKFNILFAIDDRDEIVQMWRSLGITCLQCNNDIGMVT